MEDFAGSMAQGSVLFADSVDWEVHAGPIEITDDIPAIVGRLRSGSEDEQLSAARALTVLSSEGIGSTDVRACRTEIVAAGGHDALLKFVSDKASSNGATTEVTSTLAREAATAALANLTAQNDSRALVASNGGIPILVALIDGFKHSDELTMYACGALGNLARENRVCQDEIAAAGGISALIALARAAGIEEDVGTKKTGAAASGAAAAGVANDEDDEEEEEDTGLELNASIALRKLAIGHAANYAAMRDELSADDFRYFLHGELPPPPDRGRE